MNTLRVLLFALFFKRMRNNHPSLFDGEAAAAQIALAIEAVVREESA